MKKIILKIISIFRNKKIFYGNYRGSFNPIYLFINNLYDPGRTLTRFKYKQIYKPFIVTKSIKNNYNYSDSFFTKNNFINNGDKAVLALKKNGFLLIDDYFGKDIVEEFFEKNKKYVSFGASSSYSDSDYLPYSNELKKLWLDKRIVSILKELNHGKLFCRNYPNISAANPGWDSPLYSYESEKNKSGFADMWHVDHSVLIQPAVLLNDVDESSSHMCVIPGSNRYFNVASFFLSEEYVRLNELPIAHMVGGKGSVQIHFGNTMHKLLCKKNKPRIFFKTEFTPGPNILFSSEGVSKFFSGDYSYKKFFDSLTYNERIIVSSLFPESPNKGIEPSGNWYSPTRYQGI